MRAIIFDLDGVLVSTDRFHDDAWRALAQRLELPFDETVCRRLRGVSRMAALELVSDRAKKSAAAKDVVQKVYDTAYEAGVMVRTSGANVILSPPLVITAADVGRIISALDAGLSAVGR